LSNAEEILAKSGFGGVEVINYKFALEAVNEALEWAAQQCATVGNGNGMEYRSVVECINRILSGKSKP
jgi:hypothetical protein